MYDYHFDEEEIEELLKHKDEPCLNVILDSLDLQQVNKDFDEFLKNFATQDSSPQPLRFLLLQWMSFLSFLLPPMRFLLLLPLFSILFLLLHLTGFILMLILFLFRLLGFLPLRWFLPLRFLPSHWRKHSIALHLSRSMCRAATHTTCCHRIRSPITSCYPVAHPSRFIARNTYIGQKKNIGRFSLGLRNIKRVDGKRFQRNLFHQKLQLKSSVMLKTSSNGRMPQRKRGKEEASMKQL